jgi:hypothetical protein
MRRSGWILLLVLFGSGVPHPATAAEFPYELKTDREVILWATGGIAAGLGIWLANDIEPLTPEEADALDAEDVNGFDRSATEQWSTQAATASDVAVGALMVAPVGLMAWGEGSREPWTVGNMYGQALLLSNGLVYVLKGAVERTRPFVYNPDPDIPPEKKLEKDAQRSFPSGHTANAFVAATFLGSVYAKLNPDSKTKGWVWGGALATAAAAGYLRYRAGKHYPTDILAGALVGSTVGLLVPWLHERDDLNVGAGDGGQGVQLVWGFGF